MSQTYKNLEIILIDDGSPDYSGKICDEFAKIDERIIVIHKNNEGVSNARNLGIDISTGEYIGFADPDDWMEPDYYETIVGIAETTHADITISNFYREFSDRTDMMENSKPIPDVFEDKNDAFRYGYEADVYRGFKMYLWNKVYRARFFTPRANGGMGFRMDTTLKTGIDSLLTSECFMQCKRFAYTSKAFYHYRIRENSLMRSKEFADRTGFETVLDRVAHLLEANSYNEEVILLVKRFHTYYCSQLAEYAFTLKDKPNHEYSKDQMKKYLKEYIVSNERYPERLERVFNLLNAYL